MKVLLAICLLAPAQAALVDVHVVERTDVSGAYERIVAKAYFAVDPKIPANRIITDLRHAPVNEQGLVEFSADIHVLKPRDPAQGNGTLLFEVSNRGNMGLPGMMGEEFLRRHGYTLVWTGWQFDVPEGAGRLRVRVPVAKGITGLVRLQEAVTAKTGKLSVADRGHIPYPAANLSDPSSRMFVREYAAGERTEIARNRWRFVDAATVALDGGFLPGKMYEVVYTASDPPIAGLGPAAIRDFVSFLKYGGGKATSLLGDQRRFLKRAIAFGSSQSGRFLRTYLYQGFNADERGRIVFDGMMPHIAGGSRGSFTHRFAQPSRSGPQFHSDLFPFRDLPDTDPLTGSKDGILRVAQATGTVPKTFYTNTSNEYWRSSASLTHTSLDGGSDADLPPTTRIYFLAGCQHGAGTWPPRAANDLLYRGNTIDYRPMMRALLVAMNEWVTSGKQPPPSRYPSVAAGQLVPTGAIRFPKIPEFRLPVRIWQARSLDYGPDYQLSGIVSHEPPRLSGAPFGNRLPAVDGDGNETSGIRHPVLAVPLGTHMGWNLAAVAPSVETEMAYLTGSYIPFARTREERQGKGDERMSIAERYKSREDYLAKLRAAAEELVAARYLLAEDVGPIEKRGLMEWDSASPRGSF
ncbi:MAG: alpha/beta hydrolase domain-containing protein [Bryobacteraceae bacterium]|nr:alpha/beta hydrolase domain-containing protein [Bryobacteraceae bacterium]